MFCSKVLLKSLISENFEYMGKCELFLFMLKIILLWHKVGSCLHGDIYVHNCPNGADRVNGLFQLKADMLHFT